MRDLSLTVVVVGVLQNHLIETASLETGSMLIWDTGTYEVLPWRITPEGEERVTEAEGSDEEEDQEGKGMDGWGQLAESEKLHSAFQNVRLLPPPLFPLLTGGNRGHMS